MWAALTEGVEGAPYDDYPSDINIDSTDTEELARKRDWHVEWLQAVISYYSTSQQDSVYDAIRQHVAWTGSKDKPTRNATAEWTSASPCERAATEWAGLIGQLRAFNFKLQAQEVRFIIKKAHSLRAGLASNKHRDQDAGGRQPTAPRWHHHCPI